MSMESIQEIELGTTISNEPIPKFVGADGVNYAISIVDAKSIFAVKSYFVNQKEEPQKKNILGSIHATTELLPVLGVPQLHYYILVLQYSLDGQFIKNGYGTNIEQIEFKYLKFGPANYDKLKQIANSTSDITNIDIQISIEAGKQMFQAFNLIPITGNTAKWKNIPEIVAKIELYKKMFKSIVPNLVGEQLSAKQIIDYLSGVKSETILAEHRKQKEGAQFEFLTNGNNNTPLALANAPAGAPVRQLEPAKKIEAAAEELDLDGLVEIPGV